MIFWSPFSSVCSYLYASLPPILPKETNEQLAPKTILHTKNWPPTVSYFDTSKKINQNCCAITMVRDYGRSVKKIPINTPHVRIFVESFDGRKKSVKDAHLLSNELNFPDLSAAGSIEITLYQEGEYITLKSKSQTWLISREKVERMWAQIEWEEKVTDKYRPLEYQRYGDIPEQVPYCPIRNPVPFCMFGQDSVMAEDVITFKTENPELLRLRGEDPEQFEFLADLNEKNKAIRDIELQYRGEKEGKKTDGKYPQLAPLVFPKGSLYALYKYKFPITFCLPVIVNNLWLRIFGKNKYVKITGATCLILSLICWLIDSRIKKSLESLQKTISDHQSPLSLMEKEITPIPIKPNNCFTWVRDKLAMVDIVLDKKAWEYLVAIPMPHLAETTNYM